MLNDTKDGTIKAVENSYRVLTVILEQGEIDLSGLTGQIDLSKTAIHNHVTTLQDIGVIESTDGKYRLSIGLTEYAGRPRDEHLLFKEGRAVADDLSAEIDTHVSLSVEHRGRHMTIYLARTNQTLKNRSRTGICHPIHSTASGKALLAHSGEERVTHIIETRGLPQITPNTITAESELFEELENIREQGYSICWEERTVGIRAIATAIEDRKTNELIGAIGFSGPTSELQETDLTERYPEILKQYANMIEINLTTWE